MNWISKGCEDLTFVTGQLRYTLTSLDLKNGIVYFAHTRWEHR